MDHREKIDQLHDKMEKIEALLTKIINNDGISCVNIEKLDIKGPILEYNFDKIDVDEVSGALNLGINLGVPVHGLSESKSTQPNGAKKKSTTPPTKGNQNSTFIHKEADDNHKANYPEIEKKIDEKLKEMFPKGSNKQGQQTSAQTNKTENKHSPSSEKQPVPRHKTKQSTTKPKADKNPPASKEKVTPPTNNHKRKTKKENKEEIEVNQHHMAKSSTGFSYKFSSDSQKFP